MKQMFLDRNPISRKRHKHDHDHLANSIVHEAKTNNYEIKIHLAC